MGDLKTIRFVWAVAAVAILIGVVTSVGTVQMMGDARVSLSEKAANVEELRRMAQDIADYRAARDMYDGLPSKRLPSIKKMLKSHLPNQKAKDIRSVKEKSIDGWTIRRYEMTFNNAEMSVVMNFIQELEMALPPWRLTKYVVTASGGVAGKGKISLTLEGLERQ